MKNERDDRLNRQPGFTVATPQTAVKTFRRQFVEQKSGRVK